MEVLQVVTDALLQYGKPTGYFVAGAIIFVRYGLPFIKKLRKK